LEYLHERGETQRAIVHDRLNFNVLTHETAETQRVHAQIENNNRLWALDKQLSPEYNTLSPELKDKISQISEDGKL